MLGDVLRGSLALVGVGEADLEHVVLVLDNGGGGSGGGQEEHAVGVALSARGFAWLRGGGAQDHLRAGVQSGVVGVDDLFHVVLVVFVDQFDFVSAARFIDFRGGYFRTVQGRQAVQSGRAGSGADMGDLEGDRVFRHGGNDAQQHGKRHHKSNQFLHNKIPPCKNFRRAENVHASSRRNRVCLIIRKNPLCRKGEKCLFGVLFR